MNDRQWKIESFQDGEWKTNKSSIINENNIVDIDDDREDDIEELKCYDRKRLINVKFFDTVYSSKEACEEYIEKMSKYPAVCPMRIKKETEVS